MFDKKVLFDCTNCQFKTLSCKYLSHAEFEIILRTSSQHRFNKGETILKQGTKAVSTVFLHKGIVKFNYEHDDGKNFIMTIVNGPRILGGANLFFKEINLFSIVAVEDCELCFIDNRTLNQMLLKYGVFQMALFKESIEMFQIPIFNFINLAHKQVNGRIADIILYLAEHVYKNNSFVLSLTRKEISEFAGCSAENVIHTFSRFNNEGIITLKGKNFTINNAERLREISKFG